MIFFSHRWLTPHTDVARAHPDDPAANKWRLMIHAMESALVHHGFDADRAETQTAFEAAYIWIDFASIEQDDVDATDEQLLQSGTRDVPPASDFRRSLKGRGIASLPIYIFLCSSSYP